MKSTNHGFYAYDKDDKFLKTPWYSHLGVFAAGFANGALVGGFEKGKKDVFKLMQINDYKIFKYGTDALVRSAAVAIEFGGTSLAKSKGKSISFYEFDKKYYKRSAKISGLFTYYILLSMRMKTTFFLVFAFSSLFSSCGWVDTNIWVHNGIRSKRVFKQYESEPLILKDYIYYFNENIKKQGVEFDHFKNQDSVLLQTKSSLFKTNLNFVVTDSHSNKSTEKFIKNTDKILRPKLVKNKFILEQVPESQMYIFPVIFSGITRTSDVSIIVPTPDNDFYGWSEFKIIIFIINNKKVIYKRAVRYSEFHTQTGPAITDYRSDVRLEHLGLIVEKAMEDYVKRIKKVE
jgi:hypothetical protein